MKITMKPIIPKTRLFNAARFKAEIEKAKTETKNGIQADYQKTVSTWKNKPRFYTTRRGDTWFIGTKDEIYGYVELGTKPHLIPRQPFPKKGRRLVFFRSGFKAKTKVNFIGSNAGRAASRDLTFARQVHHPGTKARNFSKEIKKKWQKLWLARVQQAIRNAIQGSK